MQLLKTTNDLIALDLGMQAIALRAAQVQASEQADRITELEARCAQLAASASHEEREARPEIDRANQGREPTAAFNPANPRADAA